MRIGLVEGHAPITHEVRDVLGRAHDVHATTVGEARRQDPGAPSMDVVILVWPGEAHGRTDAATLVAGLTAERSMVVLPTTFVADRLGLVDAGIDYVVHPFHPLELIRRVELLGDGARRTGRVLWVDDTMLDEGARRVERGRHPIDLTRKEFELLAHLLRNQGMVQERATLLESVWGSTSYNPNVIEVTVSSLRQKLERHGPRIVHTVRGIGYVCRAEHQPEPGFQTLVDHREELLAERQRLMTRRADLVERARIARSERLARRDEDDDAVTSPAAEGPR
jgi:DNA-binding response OmpR family regulator